MCVCVCVCVCACVHIPAWPLLYGVTGRNRERIQRCKPIPRLRDPSGREKTGCLEEGVIGPGSDSGSSWELSPLPTPETIICLPLFPSLLLFSSYNLSASTPLFSPWHLPSLALTPLLRRNQKGTPPGPWMSPAAIPVF